MNRKNKESNISKSTQELETQFEYQESNVYFLEEIWCQNNLFFPCDANKNKFRYDLC